VAVRNSNHFVGELIEIGHFSKILQELIPEFANMTLP
jgi:hypothetical protein